MEQEKDANGKAVKRYYWLKLKEEFFQDKEMKKLRRIAGGDTYTVIYLKLMLLSLKNDGKLYYDGIEDTFYEELALDIDEEPENVRVTLMYLEKMKLIQTVEEDELYLTQMDNLIGSESESAQRVREHRSRQKKLITSNSTKKEPKSNALRQKQFRAKKNCEEKQHIPYIEDYENNKRYNGNYYLVIQRDKFKCAICGSIENLCVHHIDGYDENKPENNNANKMIALCRGCHSKVHAGLTIDKDILESIDYYMDSNEMLQNSVTVTECNAIETKCNTYTYTDTETDTETKKNKKTLHRQEIEDFFESVWKLYINKKGKRAVSLKAKEEIFKIGYDRMKKCIEKYAKEVNGYEDRYILNGSTFFNGRYTDYLEEEKPVEEPTPLEEEPEMTDEEWVEYVKEHGLV